MAGNPQSRPINPFPLSATNRVGISGSEWSDHLEEWLYGHQAFKPGSYLPDGQPAHGRLRYIWLQILDVTRIIMDDRTCDNPTGLYGNLGPVRKSLRAAVKKAGPITKAVCMGLGPIRYRSLFNYNFDYVQQCGVFFALCQMIEEKQDMQLGTLPVFFQEPAFELEDRWILERIGRQTIVRVPAANDLMNVQSFVYAPHFPSNLLFNTICRPGFEPELLFTNTFHTGDLGSVGYAITDIYLSKVYWTRDSTVNQEAIDMYDAAKRFLQTHEGTVYWGVYVLEENNQPLAKLLRAAFSSSSFYVRRHGAVSQSDSKRPVKTLEAKVLLPNLWSCLPKLLSLDFDQTLDLTLRSRTAKR
ncbi:unnamed protein product [Aureobasidium uvarum]|uniref:SRR1-like domain-containing protein n=1 Tax=Aureobasidium uvarum TaxID=2773716 RepID=A0A9N8KTH8_9PEZI|nr:unnamed protein product [Aureobasidium uvarum]